MPVEEHTIGNFYYALNCLQLPNTFYTKYSNSSGDFRCCVSYAGISLILGPSEKSFLFDLDIRATDADTQTKSKYVRPYLLWRIRNQFQILQIQRIRPFSARIRNRIRESSKSSFDVDSLAKPEVTSAYKRKRIAMTTPANPDHSICQWIRIRNHYESESRFVRSNTALVYLPPVSLPVAWAVPGSWWTLLPSTDSLWFSPVSTVSADISCEA